MSNDKKEKEPPAPRWFPDSRADKNRRRVREEKAKAHGARAAADPAPAQDTAGVGPRPFEPDGFDLERVTCGCGRTVFAMCLVDVRGVPAHIRGEAEEVCDACWTAWLRQKKLTRAELAGFNGAPPELVEHIRKYGNPHIP